MPAIEETRALLIEKLQELFQLDQPDLDFGFYRIMHLRSREISDFLENGLLSKVQEALTEYTPVEKRQVQKQLTEAIKQAEALGVDPESVPKVKELREKLTESIDLQQVECDVYDALYHFFSRYYSDGDFISQRVYKEGVYAIPYEGEEVKLYWANADQYYVKTCEYLRDYCFRTPSNRRVHFKLIDAAEGEHGNIKAAEGKNRVFILAKDNFCSEENGELILRFEYRPATMNDWAKEERGDQSSPPNQEALLTFADTQILALSEIETWTAELSVPYIKSDGEKAGYSTLFHHLKRYAARNTFDYFIHKDLGTFLRRELDFFIKNEIMYLDDIEKETAPRVEQYLSKLRAVRRIAKKIIEFLAQLENFQKKLWLKKKFVVETNYCITLDRVPEEFYEEIAANDAQREEWKRLFDYPGTAGILPAQPGNAGFQPASSGQASCLSVPRPSLFDNISQEENGLPLWHSRGYLPHFDASICQFITFRLFDSVPSEVVLEWKKELKWDENLSANSKEAVALRQKIEKYEDQGKGSCFLADPRIASLIKDALFYFDGTRYNLLNWCIMPNHVHVLIEILENNSLADIIHSWKSYTANKANKILSRSGLFWMQEYYDRYIRDHEHYQATFDYIDNNPVKAGLVNSPNEWSWSAIGSNPGTAGILPAQPGNAGFQPASSGQASCLSVPLPSLQPAQKKDNPKDKKMQAGSLRSQEEDAGKMPAFPGNLVLDTKFFSEDFIQRLIASIDNFDEQCNGLLIHSENFQTLNLLQGRYREQVKCVYIDPPYNTGCDGFIYRDNYQHSSWMSMMNDRIILSNLLLSSRAAIFSSIDEYEINNLRYLFSVIFQQPVNEFVWHKRSGGDMSAGLGNGMSTEHEYILSSLATATAKYNGLLVDTSKYTNPDNDPDGPWTTQDLTCNKTSDERPTLAYDITDPISGNVFKFNPSRVWSYEKSNMDEMINRTVNGRHLPKVIFPTDPNQRPKLKKFLSERRSAFTPISSWLENTLAPLNSTATKEFTDLFGISPFMFPKSVKLISLLIQQSCINNEDTILDYFAGSGTTGHAVINLNREDGGNRKYILVEMGDHFETVLKPRIEKVIYSKEWKDGKPVNAGFQPIQKQDTSIDTKMQAGSLRSQEEDAGKMPAFPGHCFKYIRLESYEDTLNNLEFKTNDNFQQELKYNEDSDLQEEYILKYFLEMESKESPSLLNAEAFFEPTEYQLKIKKPGSDESVYQKVDLLETFNYLIGLKVKNIGKPERFSARFKRDQDGKLILDGKLKRDKSGLWWFRTVTGKTLDGQKVLVIWRNRPGKDVVKEDSFEMSPKNPTETGMEQDNIVLDAWFEMLGFDSESNEYDIIYVNGTNNLENLNSSNAKWKVRLIEEEFYTKMWE